MGSLCFVCDLNYLRRRSKACHAFLATNVVRGEERVTSLRTSAWEARITMDTSKRIKELPMTFPEPSRRV